ncbi:MAG: flavodoxin [Candidatus Omnitrophota bacterium]|nr:flavodoxin [Candidatus Omnitrophota bacterium]
MKSAIIYYSYSGNTRKVADVLFEELKKEYEVDVIELKAIDESDEFLKQASRAFWRKKAAIQNVNFGLSSYDLVCFGTPVWAFGPAPAINTYLDNCIGTEGKEIVLFTTYGSGAGNKHCLKIMQKELNKKGAKDFRCFSVQQLKTNDKEFVLSQIKKL